MCDLSISETVHEIARHNSALTEGSSGEVACKTMNIDRGTGRSQSIEIL